ncbi:SSI family serine proteinase inhibitor [Streptomyces tardus]|nr:SSI family serine proteinase inhibitor [Streptomyces tardus]
MTLKPGVLMLRRIATVVTVTAALSAVAGSALACPSPHGPIEKAGGALPTAGTLTVVYQEDAEARTERFELKCGPAGRAAGSHPSASRACAAVDQAVRGPKSPWEPISKDAVCTQRYGGPQTARVTGTWAGREVSADFERTNGCEIARWDTLTPALPRIGANPS